MRSTRSQSQVAEVARRRLEMLSAELAEIRPEPGDVPRPRMGDGSGGLAPDPRDLVDPVVPGRHAHRSLGLRATAAGWAHDRLPPTLQGRVRVGPAHLAAVVLVVLAALVATGWWLARSDDSSPVVTPVASGPSALLTGGPTAAVTPSASGASGLAASPSASGSGSPGGTIVIDVAGKVRRPGIARLPLGARVVDALEAAGGARRGVSLAGLNLARVLADGEQVVVGVPAVPGVAASAATGAPAAGGTSAPALVNVNSADQSLLETLPGVGPVTAQAILDYRTENGAFTAVDDLLDVSGIGDATLAEIAPFVTL